MSNTVQRIKEYIDFKRVNTRKFEESISFSNGAFASQYKNNRSIGVDKVEKILQVYPDINPIWLLTGVGEMLVSKSLYNDPVDIGLGKLSESDVDYDHRSSYKDKYIKELETELELLRLDIKQKQEIIYGFLSGKITKTNIG